MDELVLFLANKGVLKSESLIRAFKKVDRRDFVAEDLKNLAYIDEALPIGQGQTISQPYVVAFMLELLDIKPGDRIMEAGYGSGWQAALISEMVGPPGGGGRVFAFERVPELCEFGRRNFLRYGDLLGRIEFFCKDASNGVPGARLDGIIASAELSEVPIFWREQLKIWGRMVYPSYGSVFKETKKKENEFEVEEYPGFMFVPFIKDAG